MLKCPYCGEGYGSQAGFQGHIQSCARRDEKKVAALADYEALSPDAKHIVGIISKGTQGDVAVVMKHLKLMESHDGPIEELILSNPDQEEGENPPAEQPAPAPAEEPAPAPAEQPAPAPAEEPKSKRK